MTVYKSISEKKISEILMEHSDAASIFYRYGIDYCCNGNQTLTNLLESLKIKVDPVEKELEDLISKGTQQNIQFHAMLPDELIAYIIEKYHSYLHLNLSLIHEYGQFALKEQSDNSELSRVLALYADLKENLAKYLYKEEHIVFPYILNITEAYNNGLKIEIPAYRKIMHTRNFMELENSTTHEILNKIKKITDGFRVPEGAGKALTAFITKLHELEENIYCHMHLKNNVLFPKSIELENVIGLHG
jgi:regulator of cell morphogenesis and NO signaling